MRKNIEELFDRILVCLCSTFPVWMLIKALGFTPKQSCITIICLSFLVNALYDLDNWKSLRD